MSTIIIAIPLAIFIIVILFFVKKEFHYEPYEDSWIFDPEKNKKNMPREIIHSRPLNPSSKEYQENFKELVEYNNKIVRRGSIFRLFLFAPSVLILIFIIVQGYLHVDIIPIHTGVTGVLLFNGMTLAIFIMFYFFGGIILYGQFDFQPIRWYHYSIEYYLKHDKHDKKRFPQIIRPYLLQGTDAAWYFIRHRSDNARNGSRIAALFFIPLFIGVTCFLFMTEGENVIKDLSKPPQNIQIQANDFQLTYDKKKYTYHISCRDTLNERYYFRLNEKEAKKTMNSLLPYFQYNERNVQSWPDVKTVLKDGNKIYLDDYSIEDGKEMIYISVYPNTKTLCKFFLTQKD